jgi:hypothetical protein
VILCCDSSGDTINLMLEQIVLLFTLFDVQAVAGCLGVGRHIYHHFHGWGGGNSE